MIKYEELPVGEKEHSAIETFKAIFEKNVSTRDDLDKPFQITEEEYNLYDNYAEQIDELFTSYGYNFELDSDEDTYSICFFAAD